MAAPIKMLFSYRNPLILSFKTILNSRNRYLTTFYNRINVTRVLSHNSIVENVSVLQLSLNARKTCHIDMFQTHHRRSLCIESSDDPGATLKKEINLLTDKYMDAKELLNDLEESVGTVYFGEDLIEAEEAVNDTVAYYDSLLNKCGEKQQRKVVQTVGLKMEELKGHLMMIQDKLKD